MLKRNIFSRFVPLFNNFKNNNMTTVTKNINATFAFTPKELAEMFWNLDLTEKAEFFSALPFVVKDSIEEYDGHDAFDAIREEFQGIYRSIQITRSGQSVLRAISNGLTF